MQMIRITPAGFQQIWTVLLKFNPAKCKL